MDYIVFNQKNSYSDMDLLITEAISIPFSNEIIKTTTIEGRDGDLTEKTDTYPDVEIPVSFNLMAEDYSGAISNLNKWFNNIVDNKLYLPHDLYRYYKVKYVKADKIQQQLKWYGKFSVTFVCEPFCYGDEQTISITENDAEIIYQGTRKAKTKINVYGSGDITLSINNSNVILTGITDRITLDGNILDAYRDTVYMNDKMAGDFPVIIPGVNDISWIGNVSKLEITYQETYL